jgi:hypothetical protein
MHSLEPPQSLRRVGCASAKKPNCIGKMKQLFSRRFVVFACLALIFSCAGCNARVGSVATIETLVVDSPTPIPSSKTPTASPTTYGRGDPASTSTQTATRSPSQTPSQTPTGTPTETPIPTYAILRGEVLVHSACLYGPGAPYLYKYGLLPGSNLDVIGRNDAGTWILVQAIGGNNPCWLKASLMKINGDVMTVAPVYIPLPQSPYYAPVRSVLATRDGNEVTIFWEPIVLRPGDETASPPYLVEAWVCQGGQIIFKPIGSYQTFVKVTDEPGCSEPSHGRVYGVEKHGYTRWVKVPWPPFE